jgi:hypothetical protein
MISLLGDIVIEFRFICGIKTNLRVVLDQTPLGFRRAQRDLADHVRVDGWLVTIPELYAEDSSATRTNDDISLRTWDSASVGTTRLPVGLLRIVEHVTGQMDRGSDTLGGWQATSRCLKLWPDGGGTVTLSFRLPEIGRLDVFRLSEWINAQRDALSIEALRIAEMAVNAVLSALKATGYEHQLSGPPLARTVGRHRLVRIEAEPTPDLLRQVRKDLMLVGRHNEFTNVTDADNRFCYAGNGVSVEIGPDIGKIPSLLTPVLEHYEYWIAAITAMDDDLHSEFIRLSRARVPIDYKGNVMKNAARELFFAQEDVLRAMSPAHVAAWNSLMPTWSVPALEGDIRDKILAVEEVDRGLRETVANRVAARSGTLLTLLTALTLVSIVTGVAAFVLFPETRLTPLARVWLAVVSGLAALVLFSLSARPVVMARARRRR